MSFPRYPKYKASGVEWLGDVPEGWNINCIKRTTYLKARVGWKGLTSDEFQKNAFSYLVTGTDFRSKFVKWDECYQVDEPRYRDDPFIQLQNDDLLITKDGTIGKLAIVNGLDKPACLNSGIFVIRPLRAYSTKFMYWILSSRVFSVFCELESFGSTINHLYQNVFERFNFPIPPLGEQSAIAKFLDLETAKIDGLVAEQRRLMELLKEKRQAVISHAVTKGLNPHAPMKPSGIEWLGDVPAGWEARPLKHLARLQTGMTPPTDDLTNYTEDEVFQWIRPEDLNETGGPTKASKFLTEKGWSLTRQIEAGSTLICCIGTIGKIGITNDISATNQQITAAVPRGDGRFLFYAISAGRSELELASTGNVLRILNTERLGKIYFPAPPLCEQTAIAEFLDTELAKFDTLTAEAQRAIDLLQERRTALISAAVTGQIDIRQQQGANYG